MAPAKEEGPRAGHFSDHADSLSVTDKELELGAAPEEELDNEDIDKGDPGELIARSGRQLEGCATLELAPLMLPPEYLRRFGGTAPRGMVELCEARRPTSPRAPWIATILPETDSRGVNPTVDVLIGAVTKSGRPSWIVEGELPGSVCVLRPMRPCSYSLDSSIKSDCLF